MTLSPKEKKYFATHTEVGSFRDFFSFPFFMEMKIIFQRLKSILLREIKGIGVCGFGIFL